MSRIWALRLVVGMAAIVAAADAALAAPIPPSSNQLLWLAADTNVSTSGGTVTGWADAGNNTQRVSGVAGTPTQGTAAFPNGNHAVVNFDGNSGLQLNDGAALAQQTLSVFVVASLANDQQSRIFISDYHNNGASNGWASGISDSNTDQVKWFSGPDGGDTLGGTTGLTMTAGKPYIVTTTIDTTGKNASIYDGTSTVSASDSRKAIPYDGSEIAGIGYLAQFNAQKLNGNIAEVLVYNTTDPATLAGVQNYLQAKYFNPVPEPASVVLLGIAGVASAGWGWARQRAGR